MAAAAAMLIFVPSVALDRRPMFRKLLFLNRSCGECHWQTSTTLKRWGSEWMPMTLKTGLCQSERTGNSSSSDDANSAGGPSRRVALRSGPRHHRLITRCWGVLFGFLRALDLVTREGRGRGADAIESPTQSAGACSAAASARWPVHSGPPLHGRGLPGTRARRCHQAIDGQEQAPDTPNPDLSAFRASVAWP